MDRRDRLRRLRRRGAVGGRVLAELLDVLDARRSAHLPADRPRYLMGVGDPLGLVEAVARGVDLFDCVLPTRLARHGTMLTGSGRLNLANARFAGDDGPLDPACGCPTCARYSRGYLRHLLGVGEATAPRLLTLHNVGWLLDLVASARDAIRAGRFAAFRSAVAATWGPTAVT
ncbi:MAG: tRNA guanosine(34) transglycosylase Tgt [Acidimicrobiia bacterium]|nr:tRNA guanosine(34) transglycosylase Tgt [Acidimicrobiia bacterium]